MTPADAGNTVPVEETNRAMYYVSPCYTECPEEVNPERQKADSCCRAGGSGRGAAAGRGHLQGSEDPGGRTHTVTCSTDRNCPWNLTEEDAQGGHALMPRCPPEPAGKEWKSWIRNPVRGEGVSSGHSHADPEGGLPKQARKAGMHEPWDTPANSSCQDSGTSPLQGGLWKGWGRWGGGEGRGEGEGGEGRWGGRFPPTKALSGPFRTTRDITESFLSHLPFKGCL